MNLPPEKSKGMDKDRTGDLAASSQHPLPLGHECRSTLGLTQSTITIFLGFYV